MTAPQRLVMLKQYLRKKKTILYGLIKTCLRRRGPAYRDSEWFNRFYGTGVSDRQTIRAELSPLAARYHYNSVEMQIFRHLRTHRVSLERAAAVDIGSGSGHWIDFYRSLGCATVEGIDVAPAAVSHLRKKYSDCAWVAIHEGKAAEILGQLRRTYDLVNAIGVMFHIVDDAEWSRTITVIADSLKPGGLFVVGGHFGLVGGVDLQAERDQTYKRLRSGRHWRSTLRQAGFSRVDVYRNSAYLWIEDSLPENNVLVATK